MQQTLQGKVAVVTGASHGLGQAIAVQLARQGATLVLVARGRERLKAVAAEIAEAGGRSLVVTCDLARRDHVEQAARQITDELERVDILINNAGIPAPRSLEETTFDDWDEVIGVNLSAVFYLTRALWNALTATGAGYVINISGTNGRRGSSSPAYSSAKFGLTGLTRSIAASGKPYGLRATVLYPGAMDTGWRGAPIGIKPRAETMDPQEVARLIGHLVATPAEFVVNEAVLNPLADTWL